MKSSKLKDVQSRKILHCLSEPSNHLHADHQDDLLLLCEIVAMCLFVLMQNFGYLNALRLGLVGLQIYWHRKHGVQVPVYHKAVISSHVNSPETSPSYSNCFTVDDDGTLSISCLWIITCMIVVTLVGSALVLNGA